MYNEINHPKYNDLHLTDCYLCGKPLKGMLSKDHIIPNSMFPKGAGCRPQLPVHPGCNNGKSMIDERIKMRILFISSTNPVAEGILKRDLLNPSQEQKQYADLIGMGRKVRDYKLARTLARDFQHSLDVIQDGTPYVEVIGSKKHVLELNRYVSKMAQGLFIRNVPGIKPGRPEICWTDKKMMQLHGISIETLSEPLKNMVEKANASGALFGQIWPGHISYIGSPASDIEGTGWMWIEFYNTCGILVLFHPPRIKR
ncbi:MAG: hypothetical protein JWP06_758 [Candidatus Saccharibacteria bacterium]|nr:hypothetical protein [Candidatus Saccharibacteria bacterium]